jgi:hypothetical protein
MPAEIGSISIKTQYSKGFEAPSLSRQCKQGADMTKVTSSAGVQQFTYGNNYTNCFDS